MPTAFKKLPAACRPHSTCYCCLANRSGISFRMVLLCTGLHFVWMRTSSTGLMTLCLQVLNSGSARCWASEVYNPVPGVIEDASLPSNNGYKPGAVHSPVDSVPDSLDPPSQMVHYHSEVYALLLVVLPGLSAHHTRAFEEVYLRACWTHFRRRQGWGQWSLCRMRRVLPETTLCTSD